MRRYTVLAAALALTAASASASEVSDQDRFQLWNDCRPMRLVVEGMPDDAAAIGLTEDAITVAARSRLRAARIYTEARSEAAWSYSYINVNAVGPAYRISVRYHKCVNDLATLREGAATTWVSGSTGTHGRDPTYISSNLAEHIDKFIDEYLRVNEDACH